MEYAVHGAELFNDTGERLGATWALDFTQHPLAQTVQLGMKAIASFGRPTMEYIRRGRADAERGKTKQVLLNSATARCGRVV